MDDGKMVEAAHLLGPKPTAAAYTCVMSGDFFRNPLWQNFQDRRIKVFSLSEPEHRLRDARALIELKEFLPPKRLGRCEFKAVTIGGAEIPRLPEIERDEAIVVLGRPTLFGPSAIRMMRRLDPPMLYHFASDDPAQPLEYRTIVRPGRRLHVSEPFSERRRRREKYLKDGAIVYVGWTDKGPLTILCGTSTVGTWGAVRYVTSEVGALDDVRWQQELQGVLEAGVLNRSDAYDDVEVDVGELLTPVRIWMQGRDLPPWNGWQSVLRHRADRPLGESFDLQILVNGKEIVAKAKTHVPALVLLAWITSPGRRSAGGNGRHVAVAATQVAKRLDLFLGPGAIPLSQVTQTLQNLADALQRAGGLAYVEKSREGREMFCIFARDLPGYLAAWNG